MHVEPMRSLLVTFILMNMDQDLYLTHFAIDNDAFTRVSVNVPAGLNVCLQEQPV